MKKAILPVAFFVLSCAIKNPLTMDANVQRWINTFREHTRIFTESFGNLTPAELNWKANDATWSIGQVVDHLIRTNETYYPIFENIANGSHRVPWTGKVSFISNFLGKMLEQSLEPERKRKTRTFSVWEPSASSIPGDILFAFRTHHEKMVETLTKYESLFGKGIVISSPANRYVVYSLDKAVDILIVHEKRHYNQALEVKALQKGTQY